MNQKDGLMLVGLPELTLKIVQCVSKKTGLSIPDVISRGVVEVAKKHVSDAELKEIQKALEDDFRAASKSRG